MKKSRYSGFTASASVLKLVSTSQKIGKKKIRPTIQANVARLMRPAVEDCATMAMGYSIRVLPIIRSRKIATMLARMTAKMPVAEAAPMLLFANSPIR